MLKKCFFQMKPNIGSFSTPKRIQSGYILQEVLLISQPSLHVKLTMLGKMYSVGSVLPSSRVSVVVGHMFFAPL